MQRRWCSRCCVPCCRSISCGHCWWRWAALARPLVWPRKSARVVEHEVPFHTGSGDVDEMLADIQQKLDALHALNEALPDPELSAAMTRMEKAGRSIVETVEASPAKAKQVRRFANYYLPDAVNILEQYARLARQGVRGENAAAIRSEVEHNAASIATAFENQLDALYAAESMDLSADLTVLQNMLKGQGLS